MDLTLSPPYQALQAEIRAFVAKYGHLSPKVGGGRKRPDQKTLDWQKRLLEHGYVGRTIPVEYGGAGRAPDVMEAAVIAGEFGRAQVYAGLTNQGISMLVPTLLEVGTDEQKRDYVGPTIRGDIIWCQGYSEPGAGSDLASLQTRCEDRGDHWLINGQKIWTSGANLADWCFCLVRTDASQKHSGISFVLIDMRTPGVETRPIRLINGASPFCETFFTDVKVPKENLMGPLNGGWTIAKRLLQFERENISASLGAGGSPAMGQTGRVDAIARDRVGVNADGRLTDADLRHRMATHLIDARAFQLTTRRASLEASATQGPSAATSIMKYAGAKIAQDRTELAVEAMGDKGLGWEGDAFAAGDLAITRAWLRSKANSIEGGTSEVNLNVAAKRVLGLPDPK